MLIDTETLDLSCTDCGEEGSIISLQENEQTGWKGFFVYCDFCYASGYHPDKLTVGASRLGVRGEIRFIPDDAQCINCDSYILVPGAIKSEEWEVALREEEEYIATITE